MTCSSPPSARDELGAHVSAAGGVHNAPARAAALDAVVLQLFTKQPNRWAEREIAADMAASWHDARASHSIRATAAHDSYLINLASPDPTLFNRSFESFVAELRRCAMLGIDFLVTHPGNATDGDRARAIERNAGAIARALDAVPGNTRILLETTAGTGSALGCSFEELAELLRRIDAPTHTGVCLDTCHVFAAGCDLRDDYENVMRSFEERIGLEHLRLFHLNDSLTPLGSRRDRHAHIGAGTLGDVAFRSLLHDPRLADVPKLIETPKDDDALRADRRNIVRLRSFRSSSPDRARSRALSRKKDTEAGKK